MSTTRINLSFSPDEEDDILNTTIRDSDSGSVIYTIETPKYSGGVLASTATRRNQVNGSTRFAFRILWKGEMTSLKEVAVVLDDKTSEEIPARELLEGAPGSNTYGSVRIDDVEYRWKSKGIGSRMVLVNKDTNAKVAESQSRKRSSLFRKARDMSLEISDAVSLAVDVILLTFVLVWSERQNERSKSMTLVRVGGGDAITGIPLAPLPVDD